MPEMPEMSASPGGWTPEEDSEEIVRKAHKKVKRRHLVLLILLLILIGGAAGGVYWYNRYFQFENQTVGWERVLDRGDGSFTGYKKFGNGFLKYTKDGASNIGSDGKDIWIQSYEMKSPIAAVNDGYAAIAGPAGQFHLYLRPERLPWHCDYGASHREDHHFRQGRGGGDPGGPDGQLHLFLPQGWNGDADLHEGCVKR